MSTRDIVSCIAADLKAATSDLLLATPPTLDSSKAYSILHAYIHAHPPTTTSGTSVQYHPSVEKLSAEITHIYRNTFASKEQQGQRGHYRITADQISAQDPRLLILAAWLKRLLPIYEPNRFVADWWEPFLKPVLATGRWRPLLDSCSDITVDLMCSTQWTTTHVGDSKVSHERFQSMVAGAYLTERVEVWEREQNVYYHDRKHEVGAGLIAATVTSRIGAFWDTVGGGNYERVLSAFGTRKPKDFFDLMNDYCLSKRYRSHILVFLAKFVRREEAPCYFVVESSLFDTILVSAMQDDNPSVLCASISLLTSLLPTTIARLNEHLNKLFAILLRMIYWEANFAIIYKLAIKGVLDLRSNAGSDAPVDSTESSDQLSCRTRVILNEYTYVAIRQIIEDYYTLLYGMFPCNTIEFVRSYMTVKSRELPQISNIRLTNVSFERADDPFAAIRQNVVELDTFDEDTVCADRFIGLLANHRVHSNLVLSTPEQERQSLKSVQKSSSELVMESLALRSSHTSMGMPALDGLHKGLGHHQRMASMDSFASSSSQHAVQPLDERRGVSDFAILGNEAVIAQHLFPIPFLEDHNEESPLNLKYFDMGSSTGIAPTTAKATAARGEPPTNGQSENETKTVDDQSLEEQNKPVAERKEVCPDTLSSLDLDAILNTNRKLRLTIFNIKDLDLDTPHADVLPANQAHALDAELLELQLMLLLNEVNYQAFMRWHHLQHIRKLKKDQMQEDLAEADRQSVFEKLKLQHQEITILHENLNRQRQESASMRERQRRYEEELTKRVRLAKEEVGILKTNIVRLQEKIETGDKEILSLRQNAGDADGRIFQLQTELDVAKPDLEKLKECEKTIETLTKSILDRDGEVLSEKWKANKQQLLERILALQMQVNDAERELAESKAELTKQSEAADVANTKAARVASTVERIEKDAAEQVRWKLYDECLCALPENISSSVYSRRGISSICKC
ncbi:Hamartin protein-domain-containing protein [Powellomyces hirtus]|nr:Hamartin protein-domain-containing protein [Powellomyces hirtus]